MRKRAVMSVYITDEYENDLPADQKEALSVIIQDVIDEASDFVQCPYACMVEVTLTDDDSIHKINLEEREIDAPTDVLSFPMLEYPSPADFSFLDTADVGYFDPDSGELLLGDIVISLDRAKAQAEEYGHSLKREVAFLTAHSMLHLFGYDHVEDDERIEMEKMQEQILEKKGYTRDYE